MIHRFAISKDKVGVDIKLELIKSKSFGRDIVSGGNFDYKATSKKAYLVTVKPAREADPKKAKLALSKAFSDLNVESFIMNPTYLSGIITAEIRTIPSKLTLENVVEGIAKIIENTELKNTLISSAKGFLKRKKKMKIITISEELYQMLDNKRTELQDKELREYDIDQLIEKILNEYNKNNKNQ